MNAYKWKESGNCLEAWVSEDAYYTTNNSGDGLFFVDIAHNERKQLLGTCQFSICKATDKKARMRRALNKIRGFAK